MSLNSYKSRITFDDLEIYPKEYFLVLLPAKASKGVKLEIKDEYGSNRNTIILFYNNTGKLLGGTCYSPDNYPLINARNIH